jgi:hypothetical protein
MKLKVFMWQVMQDKLQIGVELKKELEGRYGVCSMWSFRNC